MPIRRLDKNSRMPFNGAAMPLRPSIPETSFSKSAPHSPSAAWCSIFNHRSGGLEILRRLKADASHLPVIVVGVSTGNVGLAVQAMKAGAVDWLETPYE